MKRTSIGLAALLLMANVAHAQSSTAGTASGSNAPNQLGTPLNSATNGNTLGTTAPGGGSTFGTMRSTDTTGAGSPTFSDSSLSATTLPGGGGTGTTGAGAGTGDTGAQGTTGTYSTQGVPPGTLGTGGMPGTYGTGSTQGFGNPNYIVPFGNGSSVSGPALPVPMQQTGTAGDTGTMSGTTSAPTSLPATNASPSPSPTP